jgi:hypothetical protein
MNIILVSGRLAKARTITLGLPQFLLLGLGMLVTVLALASAINYVMLRFAAEREILRGQRFCCRPSRSSTRRPSPTCAKT